MANSASAIKRARQTEVKEHRNQVHVTKMRNAIKKYRKAVDNDEDNQQELFNQAMKEIDSVATKGLIHANKAARDKSRLAKYAK